MAETRAVVLDLAARSKFSDGSKPLVESRRLLEETAEEKEEPQEIEGMRVSIQGMPADVKHEVRQTTERYVQQSIRNLYDVG